MLTVAEYPQVLSDFGVRLHQAIQNGEIEMDFRSISLGDPWIDPLAMVSTYGKWLMSLSQLDAQEVREADSKAEEIKVALDSGQNALATQLWGEQQNRIVDMTGGISFYDFTKNSLREPASFFLLFFSVPERKRIFFLFSS